MKLRKLKLKKLINWNLSELKMKTLKIIYPEPTRKMKNNLETFMKQKLKDLIMSLKKKESRLKTFTENLKEEEKKMRLN